MITDRSRIIAYQRCPRERYYAYHFNGTGIQRKAKALPLVFGGGFHVGSEQLLLGQGIEAAVEKGREFLEGAFSAGVALEGELPADVAENMAYVREEQFALSEGLLRAWWAFEGERFLHDFEVIEVEREGRAILSSAHDALCEGPCAGEYGRREEELILLFRPDALVRERLSGDLYVVSWKTCATFGKRNVDQARHDMQSISEMWGLMNDKEPRNWKREQAENALSDVSVPRDGTQNSVLDMGSSSDKQGIWAANSEGIQRQDSSSSNLPNDERPSNAGPISRSLVSQSSVLPPGSFRGSHAGGELSARHEMQALSRDCGRDSQGSHDWFGLSKTGKEVRSEYSTSRCNSETTSESVKIEGILYRWIVKGRREKDEWDGIYKQNSHIIYGWKRDNGGGDVEWAWRYKWPSEEQGKKFSQLGKGFRKVPIWRDYPGGVKAWVEALSANEIAPRHMSALEAIFPQSLPIERRADEVESWREQVVAQEETVARFVADFPRYPINSAGYKAMLDVRFPQYTHSCESFSGCAFRDICWGGEEIRRDPLGSGLYRIREQNHPEKEEE